MTSVVNVRGRDRDALLADPAFLYVGRGVYRGTFWKPSDWANPFKVGMKRARAVSILGSDVDNTPRLTTLDALLAVLFYRKWVLSGPLAARLPELRGRRLGCWCCDYEAGVSTPRVWCHAVILVDLVEALSEAESTP